MFGCEFDTDIFNVMINEALEPFDVIRKSSEDLDGITTKIYLIQEHDPLDIPFRKAYSRLINLIASVFQTTVLVEGFPSMERVKQSECAQTQFLELHFTSLIYGWDNQKVVNLNDPSRMESMIKTIEHVTADPGRQIVVLCSENYIKANKLFENPLLDSLYSFIDKKNAMILVKRQSEEALS